MPSIGRYTKTSKLDTTCQQPQVGATAASSSHQVDYPIPPSSDGVASAGTSLRPFCLPRNEPQPAPQTCTNGDKNWELGNENIDLEVNEVDSFEQHVDNLFAESKAQKCKGRKTTEF
ncbi:uncharacterized protein DS421_18g621500 [Arachis hypogaea]|nr:uncharacterized protein DS421_18g621500 [Arachis hypogaea]